MKRIKKMVGICLSIILLLIFLFLLWCNIRENFEDNESSSKTVIPLNIFETWETKDLPPKMNDFVNRLKTSNPEFKHTLMDADERDDFIEENFSEEVITAYRRLVPGTYQADFWRYCVLYTYGGIYLDIKYCNVSDFKLINLTDKEYFCRDIPDKCVYTAFIVCKKGNRIMKQCIDGIVENVKNNYYGPDALYPTGPGLLGRFFTEEERNNLELNYIGDYKVLLNGKRILESYPEHRDEQYKMYKTLNKKNYTDLWSEKAIYKN